MMIRSTRRAVALMMAIAMMLTLCGQALAEQMTVYAAKADAQVYNVSGAVIGTVGMNTQMTLTGLKGQICRVERGGFVAYMLKDELSATPVGGTDASPAPSPTPTPTPQPSEKRVSAYVAKENATVYDMNGGALGTLPLNTEIAVTAMKYSICQISHNGNTAYMFKEDLSAMPMSTAPTPAPAPTAPVQNVNAYVARDGATLYDVNGGATGTLALNTAVTVTAMQGSVCQISYNGSTGYMRKGDLSATQTVIAPSPTPVAEPSPTPPTQRVNVYVAKEGATVVDANGTTVATLALNTEVTVLVVKKGICQVKSGAIDGFMQAADLSCDKVQTAAATPAAQ